MQPRRTRPQAPSRHPNSRLLTRTRARHPRLNLWPRPARQQNQKPRRRPPMSRSPRSNRLSSTRRPAKSRRNRHRPPRRRPPPLTTPLLMPPSLARTRRLRQPLKPRLPAEQRVPRTRPTARIPPRSPASRPPNDLSSRDGRALTPSHRPGPACPAVCRPADTVRAVFCVCATDRHGQEKPHGDSSRRAAHSTGRFATTT